MMFSGRNDSRPHTLWADFMSRHLHFPFQATKQAFFNKILGHFPAMFVATKRSISLFLFQTLNKWFLRLKPEQTWTEAATRHKNLTWKPKSFNEKTVSALILLVGLKTQRLLVFYYIIFSSLDRFWLLSAAVRKPATHELTFHSVFCLSAAKNTVAEFVQVIISVQPLLLNRRQKNKDKQPTNAKLRILKSTAATSKHSRSQRSPQIEQIKCVICGKNAV